MIGAGVVGCAVALALSRRSVTVSLLEAEDAPGLAASGTNSGILHTGFDSVPGELETELILASASFRDPLMRALQIPVVRCGAVMVALDEPQRAAVAALGTRAQRNGVIVRHRTAGELEIPGEAVTDPVVYTLALAAEAQRQGAELKARFRVAEIEPGREGMTLRAEDGRGLRCRVAVNSAGLYADAVARLVGDDSFSIYPRKGEFLVFEPPEGAPLKRILLPVPSPGTKGVLVFPTVDGKVVAGPTAVDLEDKRDWSIRPTAREEILPKAVQLYPELEGNEPIAAYAGLRPAGRGVNYRVEPSGTYPRLVHAAAIRSTGLSASLGVGDHVAAIVRRIGVPLGTQRELRGGPAQPAAGAWWQRTARHWAVA